MYSDIDTLGRFLSYDKLNDEIAAYKLSLFNPSKYVAKEFQVHYQTSSRDPFTQADRENYLIGMMKVNFLKRLESSVKSFEITMDRTIRKLKISKERSLHIYLVRHPALNRRNSSLILVIPISRAMTMTKTIYWSGESSNIDWNT